jgi:hypothetical protein
MASFSSYEHDNEPPSSIKGEEFLNQLSDHQCFYLLRLNKLLYKVGTEVKTIYITTKSMCLKCYNYKQLTYCLLIEQTKKHISLILCYTWADHKQMLWSLLFRGTEQNRLPGHAWVTTYFSNPQRGWMSERSQRRSSFFGTVTICRNVWTVTETKKWM